MVFHLIFNIFNDTCIFLRFNWLIICYFMLIYCHIYRFSVLFQFNGDVCRCNFFFVEKKLLTDWSHGCCCGGRHRVDGVDFADDSCRGGALRGSGRITIQAAFHVVNRRRAFLGG